MNIIEIITVYHEELLNGLSTTIYLFLSIMSIGIFIGFVLGKILFHYSQYQKFFYLTHGFIISIPIIVLLFWFHYPFQSALGISINPFILSICLLFLFNGFIIAKIILENLNAIPNQFREVAILHNFSPQKIFLTIELPLLLRSALAELSSQQMQVLHITIFTSLISVEELFRVVQRINSIIYQPIETYTALAIFFIVISIPFQILSSWAKNKYSRNFSEK